MSVGAGRYSTRWTGISSTKNRRNRSKLVSCSDIVRKGAHRAIVPCDVCIRQHLREHRAISCRAKCRVASLGELELFTKEHEECGALLGCSECDQLGNLKYGDAECAIATKSGIDVESLNLSYCVLED